jgi:hypothetical protein
MYPNHGVIFGKIGFNAMGSATISINLSSEAFRIATLNILYLHSRRLPVTPRILGRNRERCLLHLSHPDIWFPSRIQRLDTSLRARRQDGHQITRRNIVMFPRRYAGPTQAAR